MDRRQGRSGFFAAGAKRCWLVSGLLLTAAVACSEQGPAGIAFVGLSDATCEEATQVLFGKVPVRLVPVGKGTFARVSLAVNDQEALTVDQQPFQLELDTAKLADGTAQLRAEGTSEDGSVVSAAIDVCIDNSGPTLTVLSPSDGASVTIEDAELAVRVHANDQMGIESLVARLEASGVYQEETCSPATGPDAVCSLRPGVLGLELLPGTVINAAVTVTARDRAGHETEATSTVKLGTRLLWHFWAGAKISWAAAALPDGNVAVGTDAGTIHVVDASGNEACRWQAPAATTGNPDGVASAPTVSEDGKSLFFTTIENLWSLDPATCAPLWPNPVSGLYYASRVAYYDAGDVLFVGRDGTMSSRGTLRAHRGANGAALGSFELTSQTNAGITSSPMLSDDGSTVYIGSSDRNLYAINVSLLYQTSPGAMDLSWQYSTGAKIDTRPLLGQQGRIYLAGFDGLLHAVDANAGNKVSGFTFKAGGPFSSDPVQGTDGTLYAGSLDEYLYALDGTGKALGKQKIGRMLFTSPQLGPGGVVFAAATNPGRLHAFSAQLGELLWYFQPKQTDQFRASPSLDGQILYIGNTNGYLYALDATPPGG